MVSDNRMFGWRKGTGIGRSAGGTRGGARLRDGPAEGVAGGGRRGARCGSLIAIDSISLREAGAEVGKLLPVVGFLAAVLVLARLCDDEGLFRAAGTVMARSSARDPRRLLVIVFIIASATTAILSLDATVVLLTPVVLATARTLTVPARPHAYATAHLANTASLLLPVSNLTNLLAFGAAGLSFVHFAAVMTLPWLAAVGIEFLLMRWFFARELSGPTGQRIRARSRCRCSSSLSSG